MLQLFSSSVHSGKLIKNVNVMQGLTLHICCCGCVWCGVCCGCVDIGNVVDVEDKYIKYVIFD